MSAYRIDLLHENDRTNGWAAHLPPRSPRPHLSGDIRADWLVIGAGRTDPRRGTRRLLPERSGVTKGTIAGVLAADLACGRDNPLLADMEALGRALAASAGTGSRARRAGASLLGVLAVAGRSMSALAGQDTSTP